MPRILLTGALLLSLGTLMIPRLALAEDEEFYLLYLERKIAVCEKKAQRIDSNMDWIRNDARARRCMAEYLRNNMDSLVSEMAAENIEPKPYKIEYFLIKKHQSKWLRETSSN